MKEVKTILVLLVTLCSFLGCLSDKEESDYYKTVEVTILAETTMIKCCVPDPTEDKEAMIVKVKGGEIRHLLMGEIKGFTYEKGYEYQLLIQEKHLADPPQDGGSIEYTLVKQVSKTKK